MKGYTILKTKDKEAGKIYFASAEQILSHIHRGWYIAEVEAINAIKIDEGYYADSVVCGEIKEIDLNELKHLKEEGADIHVDGENVLRTASKEGKFDIVQYVLQQGADVSAINNQALRLASQKGHLEVIKLLLEYGADASAKRYEAFTIACRFGQQEVVEYFIHHQLIPKECYDSGFVRAAVRGYVDIANFLKNVGANAESCDEIARHAVFCQNEKLIQNLKRCGVNVEI